MTAGGSHLQGTLHALLSLHVGKVEVEAVLLLIEFPTGVHQRRFILSVSVQETDNIRQVVHSVDRQIVDDGGLTSILTRNEQSLEMLLPGSDGYRKSPTDGFQFPVQTELADHHIVGQHRLADLTVSSQDANG